MASNSQAMPVGYLLSPHIAFQGYAVHTARWPAMLSPNGSSGTCMPDGVDHIPMPCLHGAIKHALTHEVASSSLLLERRRMLHARIVTALEALAGDRLAEHVERLAHHAVRGEVWEKALAYFQQAGEKAMVRSAHREAVA